MNEFTLQNDFIFINAKYEEVIKNNNKIDIIINFGAVDKFYVEKIFLEILLLMKKLFVILWHWWRWSHNEILFNNIQNLKSKNIFKTVKYNTKDKDELNKVIDITVEEKATGELFAGAGTGTTGTSVSAGIKENNYLGLGIKLDTNLSVTDDTIKGRFSVTNPNYNNTDKTVKTVIESSADDFMIYGTKPVEPVYSRTEFEQKWSFCI